MRSKLVDIEAEVLGDGFVLGSTESEGNFAEDGFPDFKWSAKVSEIEMDLTSISSLCESMMGGEESGEDDSMGGGMSCEALLGGAAGSVLQSISEDLTRGMRAVEVKIEWQNAGYSEGFSTRTIILDLISILKEVHVERAFFTAWVLTDRDSHRGCHPGNDGNHDVRNL